MQQVPLVGNPKQGTEATKSLRKQWVWVETSIWTDNMLTALVNGVKGNKWFSLIDKVFRPKTLNAAWKQVKSNKGSAGIDKMSIEIFSAKHDVYLQELHDELKSGLFEPQAVRRVYIPKADGGKRPLGIPCVKDRIVQTAMKMVMEPIFETDFCNCSYGFRPQRSAKDALREVDRLLQEGYKYIVDADISKYFDTICHTRLLIKIKDKISDNRMIALIEKYLKQNIIEGLKEWESEKGSPQGAVLSPLLANIYLHDFDCIMVEQGIQLVRYADDWVILAQSQEDAHKALVIAKAWMEENQLTLHPDKTQICCLNNEGESFQFLGYVFINYKGKLKRWVRNSSLKKLRDKIREKTKRMCGKSIKDVIKSLNPTLKGWFNYFKHADKWTFVSIDGFIRRRLRSILRSQEKRPGFGISPEDSQRWPNIFFANLELFTMKTQHTLIVASQSRCGNN